MDREKDAAIALETLRRMGRLKTSGFISVGDLYHNLGLYDISLSRYEEALAKKEKLSLSQYIRVARILIERGSYEDGFSYLRKIEQVFGGSFSAMEKKEVLLLQAEVLKATGKNEESAKLLREMIILFNA